MNYGVKERYSHNKKLRNELRMKYSENPIKEKAGRPTFSKTIRFTASASTISQYMMNGRKNWQIPERITGIAITQPDFCWKNM